MPEGYQKPSEDKIWTEVTVNKDTQGTGGVVVDSESPTNLEGPDNPDPTDSENPGDPTPEPQPDQTHTKNTTVRLTGSTLDTYNVLSNIAITNGSVI